MSIIKTAKTTASKIKTIFNMLKVVEDKELKNNIVYNNKISEQELNKSNENDQGYFNESKVEGDKKIRDEEVGIYIDGVSLPNEISQKNQIDQKRTIEQSVINGSLQLILASCTPEQIKDELNITNEEVDNLVKEAFKVLNQNLPHEEIVGMFALHLIQKQKVVKGFRSFKEDSIKERELD